MDLFKWLDFIGVLWIWTIVLWYHMQRIYVLIIILGIGLIPALAFLFVGITQTCEIIHLAAVHGLLIMMPIKELHKLNFWINKPQNCSVSWLYLLLYLLFTKTSKTIFPDAHNVACACVA